MERPPRHPRHEKMVNCKVRKMTLTLFIIRNHAPTIIVTHCGQETPFVGVPKGINTVYYVNIMYISFRRLKY